MNHDTLEVLSDKHVVHGIKALNKESREVIEIIPEAGFFCCDCPQAQYGYF